MHDSSDLELRVQQLELQVKQLFAFIEQQPRTTQIHKLCDQSIQKWYNSIEIGENEYTLLTDYSYIECLKKVIYLNIQYKNNVPLCVCQRKLFIYNEFHQWTPADLPLIQDILENISLKFHGYYFKSTQAVPTDYPKSEKDKELELIYLCKLNENKFREETKLKEVMRYIISVL
jgi:hypothetical protein